MHSGADAIKILQECSSSSHLPPTPLPPRDAEAPAEPDVSVQFSVFSNRKIPLRGRHHHKKRSFFRVIPRPSFPAEPKHTQTNNIRGSAGASPSQGGYDRQRRQHHTTRSNFRVIPRYSAAIISRRGEQPHKPNSVRRLGRSLALPGLPARRQPRPPRWNQRAPVRCPLSRQHPLASAKRLALGMPLQLVPCVVRMLLHTAHFILR